MALGGHMLHGVKRVIVVPDPTEDVPEGEASVMSTDGRVYMWANGAVTVYSDDTFAPWQIIPAHRVISIEGGEHG